MKPGIYDAVDDPYAYPGTTTLRNKLRLKDRATLEAFELEMSALRANEPLPNGDFGPLHYRRVHRHLFQDVYSWAGKYRSVRIAKDGNAFCFPEHIEAEMDRRFAELHFGPCFAANNAIDFADGMADFLAELNAIHPFREGNGRAQLAFVHLIGETTGYPFDFTRIRRQTFLPAVIASYHGNIGPLATQLGNLLR